MDEQRIRQIFAEEFAKKLGQDKYVFTRDMEIANGRNIDLGKSVGTMFGTEGYVSGSNTGQKIAFLGKTPRVQYPTGYLLQPTGGGGSAGDANDQNARARINDINALLVAFGFAYDVT